LTWINDINGCSCDDEKFPRHQVKLPKQQEHKNPDYPFKMIREVF
jgi:hypothetical protein